MSEDESFGSDDDILSPGGSSVTRTTFASEDEKRAHHNALERKRRDHIKHSFNSLRDAVPNLDGKVSRAEILKRAAEYIKIMKKRNVAHQQDIHDLQGQNRVLEAQINQIQMIRDSSSGVPSSVSGLGGLGNVGAGDAATSEEDTDSGMSADDLQQQQLRKRVKTC